LKALLKSDTRFVSPQAQPLSKFDFLTSIPLNESRGYYSLGDEEFQNLLEEVSKSLTKKEMMALAEMYEVQRSISYDWDSAMELFKLLQKRGLLSLDNTSDLIEYLKLQDRGDLAQLFSR
jgi:hypothetical protein